MFQRQPKQRNGSSLVSPFTAQVPSLARERKIKNINLKLERRWRKTVHDLARKNKERGARRRFGMVWLKKRGGPHKPWYDIHQMYAAAKSFEQRKRSDYPVTAQYWKYLPFLSPPLCLTCCLTETQEYYEMIQGIRVGWTGHITPAIRKRIMTCRRT